MRPVSKASGGSGASSGLSVAKNSPTVRVRSAIRRSSSSWSQMSSSAFSSAMVLTWGTGTLVAAEPADLALHAALLMGALQAGLAIEGIQAGPGPEGGPPVSLHPGPGEAEHAGHRRSQVVVADLPRRHAAQHVERVHVAFEERLLPLRSRDAVHRLTGEGQPEHEHVAQGADPGQVDVDVAEIDLGVLAGPVDLRDEHLRRPAARLDPDLRLADRNVGPDHRIRDAVPVPIVLGHQPVKDPLGGMPLLTRGIKISPQDPVDRLFMPIQTGRARGKLLPRPGPRR